MKNLAFRFVFVLLSFFFFGLLEMFDCPSRSVPAKRPSDDYFGEKSSNSAPNIVRSPSETFVLSGFSTRTIAVTRLSQATVLFAPRRSGPVEGLLR